MRFAEMGSCGVELPLRGLVAIITKGYLIAAFCGIRTYLGCGVDQTRVMCDAYVAAGKGQSRVNVYTLLAV
jgi:hypothetical protein